MTSVLLPDRSPGHAALGSGFVLTSQNKMRLYISDEVAPMLITVTAAPIALLSDLQAMVLPSHKAQKPHTCVRLRSSLPEASALCCPCLC